MTARVPTRTNRDDRYFTDTYQAKPLHGYTRMFQNMLRVQAHHRAEPRTHLGASAEGGVGEVHQMVARTGHHAL